jgi:hypothetical protein
MRKTKRFTRKVLARFTAEGRGKGIYEAYVPWHRVTRGDPSSSGRSHLLVWRERFRELLSDGEFGEQLFAAMVPGLDDCLEQFALSHEASCHILASYGEGDRNELFPGTVELAKRLGVKHPMISCEEGKTLWTATTDFVLVIRKPDGSREAIAVAFKPGDIGNSRRKAALLRLEREYWLVRGVTWLLVTPAQYDQAVRSTILRIAPWALERPVSDAERAEACRIARHLRVMPVSRVIEAIADCLGHQDRAQRALWQAVWRGELPIDLRRGWRPHLPLVHASPAEFLAFNPVAARRSAWN